MMAETHGQDNLGRPIDLSSSVKATQWEFDGELSVLRRNLGGTFADVSLGDTLWLDMPGAGANEITNIPVELCFEFLSMWTPETSTTSGSSAASARIQIARFNYNGYASQDRYTLGTNILQVEGGQWVQYQCNSGTLDMKGPGSGYTLRLLLDITGHLGNEYHPETNTFMVTKNGTMRGRLYIKSLPAGVTCSSASEMFPGCDDPF